MTLEYRIGDVFARLAEIPDGSIDLVVTSPPFLALRSYLPADHPDKHREIGSEATPADFLDTLLGLSAEWGRVLAPHGSICVELGDTYAGSGGAGGDYSPGGLREGQDKFEGSGYTARQDTKTKKVANAKATGGGIANLHGKVQPGGNGWPLAKSLTGIPTLYPWSLAYGRNLLTGQPSPAGQWRIRNLIVWARPNPPVGALGDKFRPATSYITVACRSAKRYFDLDAVRGDYDPTPGGSAMQAGRPRGAKGIHANPAGAPPLDWHADDHPEDGDWLWKLSTQPFSGTAKTVRWERVEAGAPGDDIRRIASPDCPRHGGLPGQVPKALRDAHAADRASRNGRTDDRHAQAQLDGFESTDQPHDDSTEATEPLPADDPAATPHSKASRKTALALATNPAGTPSAQTAADTARTSASRGSSERDLDSGESSTSSGDSAASREHQTPGGTADTQPPCTCSLERKIVESTSHYATFPMALPKRLIEAMCPLRVCQVCGKPSERIVEDNPDLAAAKAAVGDKWQSGGLERGMKRPGGADRMDVSGHKLTLGFTDCGHDNWRTGIVLDPFAGSGTTLEAAQAVGRHAIGIDLDPRNADLARERVGMFLTIDEGAAA